jgi:hypothetical protein
MEWTKKNWKIALIIAVFNILLSGIVAFTVNAFSQREEALQGAAPITYVDKKCEDTRIYIDKQDGLLNERLGRVQDQVNIKADKTDVTAMRTTIDNMFNLMLQMATDKQIKRAKLEPDTL